jgi:hypothetical protein
MSVCPKSAWGGVKAMLHSVYDQPDADSVNAQFDKLLDTVTGPLPAVAETSTPPAPRSWRLPPSPRNCGGRSGTITPTSG